MSPSGHLTPRPTSHSLSTDMLTQANPTAPRTWGLWRWRRLEEVGAAH